VDKPRSLKELYHIVDLIEETSSFAKELREWSRHISFPVVVEKAIGMRPVLLLCNQGRGEYIVEMLGLWPVRPFQPDCPQKSAKSGNEQSTGGRMDPGPSS